MRHLFTSSLLLFSLTLFSQNSGRGFSFQGIARDASGNIRTSENISLRINFLEDVNSSASYVEEQVATTDPFGVFSIIIGKGVQVGSTEFKDLDFRVNDYWIRVEVLDNSQYVEVNTQRLLSVPYAENTFRMPAGIIVPFAGDTTQIPPGWMLCNGKLLDQLQYTELYAAIGNTWGGSQASGQFRVPDLRGVFLRGVDNGRGYDPEANTRIQMYAGESGSSADKVGSFQEDEFESHAHTFSNNNFSGNGWTNGTSYANVGGTVSTNPTGGTETRPKNAYVNYIIKY